MKNPHWNGTLVDGKTYLLEDGQKVVMHSNKNQKLVYSFWAIMYEGREYVSSYKEAFTSTGMAYHNDCRLNVVGEVANV